MNSTWPEWPVCRFDELRDTGARGFYVGEGEWPFRGFVVRQGPDLFAYANVCPHRRHPLDGTPDDFLVDEGRLIRCASHGALFSPETGLCLIGPCQGKNLLRLEVRIDQSGLVVVRAPASLLDAGPIIGTVTDTN
jgi:nitrite reductase/ring-hydroxylating ferredoxin subunit